MTPNDTLSPQTAVYTATQRVARLATADKQGRPYVVPVCFAFDGHGFYIALDAKPKSVEPTRLKRVRNILDNPHVSLLIDTYDEVWSRLAYVMVNGEASLIEPGMAEHRNAVQLLRDKYPQYREMPIGEQPIISILPITVHEWHGGETPDGSAGAITAPRMHMDFAALVRGRHVVRQYKPIPIPRELVEQTIEAAGWAPSPHGAQPWRFVVLTQPEPKKRLAEAMAAEWRRNLEMDGQEPEVVETRLRKSQQRITASPVLIVPCLYLEELDSYPDESRRQAEATMAVQSIGAAIQNLLLSAYSLGLDTGWMCAPLFCPDVVQDALNLPPTLTPHALLNLGYGAKDPPRHPHRPVGELIVGYE